VHLCKILLYSHMAHGALDSSIFYLLSSKPLCVCVSVCCCECVCVSVKLQTKVPVFGFHFVVTFHFRDTLQLQGTSLYTHLTVCTSMGEASGSVHRFARTNSSQLHNKWFASAKHAHVLFKDCVGVCTTTNCA
jgi:hypothetical protein